MLVWMVMHKPVLLSIKTCSKLGQLVRHFDHEGLHQSQKPLL